MNTYCVITVPISGVDEEERAKIFRELIDACCDLTEPTPVVVLDTKTAWRGHDKEVNKLNEMGRIKLIKRLSVDTCQMWLEGWNHVLSEVKEGSKDRIVLLPGDLVEIADRRIFYNHLANFIKAPHPGMLIGQFSVQEATSGKALIDQYGVYPLLANWFPKVSKTIHDARIIRPRSEFLNMDATLLKKLLEQRNFAYEQTLNMIIRIVETPDKVGLGPPEKCEKMDNWVKKYIRQMDLGEISDDSSGRAFSGCIDQIERTDRLLRFVWRELNKPQCGATDEEYQKFLSDYSVRSSMSSDIRNVAMVAIRALLGT